MRTIRLGACAVIAILTLSTAAMADSKVDWSQYLESPAERSAAKKPAAKQAKPAKAVKAPAKRVARAKQSRPAKPRRR